MNRIFCLETEWEQTVHDLKSKSAVLPLLDFLRNTIKIDYSFRQVATKFDFRYYIEHLQQPSYSAYDLIYLCFHGQKRSICFADKTDFDLLSFAENEEYNGIFENRNVHFGSCSTMKMTYEDIKTFKRLTKSRMVTGYTKDVDITSSFIFEAWLLNTIHTNEGYAASALMLLQRRKCRTSQKYLVLKHFDFYKQKRAKGLHNWRLV